MSKPGRAFEKCPGLAGRPGWLGVAGRGSLISPRSRGAGWRTPGTCLMTRLPLIPLSSYLPPFFPPTLRKGRTGERKERQRDKDREGGTEGRREIEIDRERDREKVIDREKGTGKAGGAGWEREKGWRKGGREGEGDREG